MCRSLHTNFFHNCGHEQFVSILSLNPTCSKRTESRAYHYEYCPRCSWTGLIPYVYPRVYEERGPGISCDGYTGEVTRTVRMPQNVKYNYTPETLWAERRRHHRLTYEYTHLRSERAYAILGQTPEQLGLNVMEKARFIRASRAGVQNPSPDFYIAFGEALHLIPEGDDTCAICQGRTNLGVDHPDSCEGGGFIDEASNEVGGEPVFIPCAHVFGLGCIRRWVEGMGNAPPRDTCPICKHGFHLGREAPYAEPAEWAAEYEWDILSIVGKFMSLTMKDVRRWTIIMAAYYSVVGFVIFCYSHPLWMSWTNQIVLTLGAVIYWWNTPRDMDIERVDSSGFRPYIRLVVWGNLIELLAENISRGWYVRWYDYVWTLAYPYYFLQGTIAKMAVRE
ncbi:hypothetical protein EG329_005561 [Mollisiaceae sp. DMI_Dod_QoI]|nr:hypothetical protein EG329_005561 [Helotiales sp. DMI_Dod_QoI]